MEKKKSYIASGGNNTWAQYYENFTLLYSKVCFDSKV